MSVIVYTNKPKQLLASIKEAMSAGAIRTWSYDADGDFTHVPDQWSRKAWFRPRLLSDQIVFNIITPAQTVMSRMTYAVYHGRFVEMLLTHFDEDFERAVASALPTKNDITKSS